MCMQSFLFKFLHPAGGTFERRFNMLDYLIAVLSGTYTSNMPRGGITG
jgi:hypothetical protein